MGKNSVQRAGLLSRDNADQKSWYQHAKSLVLVCVEPAETKRLSSGLPRDSAEAVLGHDMGLECWSRCARVTLTKERFSRALSCLHELLLMPEAISSLQSCSSWRMHGGM